MVTLIDDLGTGLALGPDGRPARVLSVIRLDDWHEADEPTVSRAARAAAGELAVTVGIAGRQPPAHLRPLWQSLTVNLARSGIGAPDHCFVAVPEPDKAIAAMADKIDRNPQACIALTHLLRQTALVDTATGLAAEAAVYSMLLGGTEFARWLAGRDSPRSVRPVDRPLVRARRDGARLSLVLDRPHRRNAFSFGMREELFDALQVAVTDDTIERVELTGAGPVFCSGGDLSEFGTATDLVAAYLVRIDRAPWRLIDRIRDRVSVRLHGAAVGAGIELAAFAGRVIAAPETFFLLPEAGMGLVPGAGGTVSVTRRIGRWRTAWMVLAGARVDARTALEWRLVDEIDEQWTEC